MHGFLLALAMCSPLGQESDAQILSMGHRKWIETIRERYPRDLDQLVGAEKRYALALGYRVNEAAQARTDLKELGEVRIGIANVVKAACRLADYVQEGTSGERLYNAKAMTLANITLQNYIYGRQPATVTAQADIWNAYEVAKAFHSGNEAKIEEYGRLHGGYAKERYPVEYDALGWHIKRTLQGAAKSTPNRKQSLFHLCLRMVNLTKGEDPMPYD